MALTPKQRGLITAMLANPYATQTKLAEITGLTQSWISQLCSKPEFKEELDKAMRDLWRDSARGAMRTMINLSTNGDREASKFILQSAGYSPDNKIQIEVPTTIKVSIDGN